jgi:dipeptidyl aminopeptidase/acylaminoacyl peptidase
VRARVPGADNERERSWLGSSGARSLSTDGRHLLMVDVGQRSGATYGIVLRATDGSETVRLGTGSAQRLSPDGLWAAAILAQPAEVVLYPTGPGTPRRLAGGRFETITSVQWFPDGQQVLVCGSEPKRQPRCFRTDLTGATFRPVSGEAASLALAPDGRTALVTSADGTRRLSTLGASDSRPISALTAADRVVGWSRTSTAVFVQRGTEVPALVERVDLATGVRTPSRTLVPAGVDEAASVVVADWVSDGQWYVYNYTHSPSVLFVVAGVTP